MSKKETNTLQKETLIHNLETNPLPQENPYWQKTKRLLITLMGIFIIFLFLSYFWSSFPLSTILSGKLESKPVQDNKIILPNATIIFENDTLTLLQQQYFSVQKTEFSLCLLGDKINSDYHITSFYPPVTLKQTFNQVVFEPCSKDTLVMLHSHPYKSCLGSEQDLQTLKETQKSNPDTIMIIMCEPGRFSVYG